MAHQLIYQEWQSASGVWHCNDVKELTGPGSLWYTPARLLNISPAEFVTLLVKEYNAIVKYIPEKNLLLYRWRPEDYSKCHSFVLYINRMSRKRNFIV